MGQSRVLFDNPDNVVLEVGVMICKLVGKGGEDVFEFPPVEVISGTEEAGTQEPLIVN